MHNGSNSLVRLVVLYNPNIVEETKGIVVAMGVMVGRMTSNPNYNDKSNLTFNNLQKKNLDSKCIDSEVFIICLLF